MPDLSVKRTLVKSPPELWSEVSEVESLARHLGEFGEISITRLDPEHTVAWEGDDARGTVELEASGWGTKVILSADLAPAATLEMPAIEVDAEPEPEPESAAAEPPREGWFKRWLYRQRTEGPQPAAVAEPVSEPELEPDPEPVVPQTAEAQHAESVLEAVLDNLGSAHHRPFSRQG